MGLRLTKGVGHGELELGGPVDEGLLASGLAYLLGWLVGLGLACLVFGIVRISRLECWSTRRAVIALCTENRGELSPVSSHVV